MATIPEWVFFGFQCPLSEDGHIIELLWKKAVYSGMCRTFTGYFPAQLKYLREMVLRVKENYETMAGCKRGRESPLSRGNPVFLGR
ncbi:hypothetical protein [Desulfobotulus alkaliphilus]|uniref:hypothetical protein n=1 Tax=Desulfobotulus alkaliphilus TaxID=622671 RepID=UPI00119E1AA2|nr:hypothetical protein [Desulfobotulus alkaliphilus]